MRCHLIKNNKIAYFHSAHYYSPITFHPFYKNGDLTRLPRAIRNARSDITLSKPATKLFCLRRTGARSIPQSDVAILRRIFEPLGFIFYYPEENSVENQFVTFSSADFIIGIMGAGMCNSLFTPSGATLLYIAPNGWEETFFWNLANQLQHDYHAYYCNTNLESDTPEANTLLLDIEDFYEFFLRLSN